MINMLPEHLQENNKRKNRNNLNFQEEKFDTYRLASKPESYTGRLYTGRLTC